MNITTITGRIIPAPPSIDTSTNQKAHGGLKKVDAWLRQQAIDEAKSRNDDFNLISFENAKKLSPSDRDGMNLYLFGEENPVLQPVAHQEDARINSRHQPVIFGQHLVWMAREPRQWGATRGLTPWAGGSHFSTIDWIGRSLGNAYWTGGEGTDPEPIKVTFEGKTGTWTLDLKTHTKQEVWDLILRSAFAEYALSQIIGKMLSPVLRGDEWDAFRLWLSHGKTSEGRPAIYSNYLSPMSRFVGRIIGKWVMESKEMPPEAFLAELAVVERGLLNPTHKLIKDI